MNKELTAPHGINDKNTHDDKGQQDQRCATDR